MADKQTFLDNNISLAMYTLQRISEVGLQKLQLFTEIRIAKLGQFKKFKSISLFKIK